MVDHLDPLHRPLGRVVASDFEKSARSSRLWRWLATAAEREAVDFPQRGREAVDGKGMKRKIALRSALSLFLVRVGAPLLVASTAACSSGGGSSPAADPYSAPSGCKQTLCDFVYAACVPPAPAPSACSQCFTACSEGLDPTCGDACGAVCAEPAPAPPPNPCDTALDSCRQSSRNTLCADDLTTPGPNGEPCNDALSEASCACVYDDACTAALEAAAPACYTCSNAAFTNQCAGVCQDEIQAFTACAQQNCPEGGGCDDVCMDSWKAANDCLWAVLEDPNDTTGCRAASDACWTLPACTDSLTAVR
jgi:hypothetical protein